MTDEDIHLCHLCYINYVRFILTESTSEFFYNAFNVLIFTNVTDQQAFHIFTITIKRKNYLRL